MTTDVMPVLVRLMMERERLNDPDEQVIGMVPARHFLDVANDYSRPTTRKLVRAILDHHKWSIYRLSTHTGIPLGALYAVVNRGQEGMYPANQKKLMKAVNGVPALVAMYRQTDWGKAQQRRTR